MIRRMADKGTAASIFNSSSWTESNADRIHQHSHLPLCVIGNATQATENKPYFQLFELIISLILLFAVALPGLVGNSISMFILSRPQMKTSLNVILMGNVYKIRNWDHNSINRKMSQIKTRAKNEQSTRALSASYFMWTHTVYWQVANKYLARTARICQCIHMNILYFDSCNDNILRWSNIGNRLYVFILC